MKITELLVKSGVIALISTAASCSIAYAEVPVIMEETHANLPAYYEDYPYDTRGMSDAYMGRNYRLFQPFQNMSMKRIFGSRNNQLDVHHDYLFGIDQEDRLYLSMDGKAPIQITELTGAKEVYISEYGGYYTELQDGSLWYADFSNNDTKNYPKPRLVENQTKQVVLTSGEMKEDGYFTIDGNNNLVRVEQDLSRKIIDQDVTQLGAAFDLLPINPKQYEFTRGIYYLKNNQLWAYTPLQESEKQMLCDQVTQLSDRYFYWNDRHRMVKEVTTSFRMKEFQIKKPKDLPSSYKEVLFNGRLGYARKEMEDKNGLYEYIIQEDVVGYQVANDTMRFPDMFVNPWKALPELKNIRDLTSADYRLYLLNEKGQVYSLGNGEVYDISP